MNANSGNVDRRLGDEHLQVGLNTSPNGVGKGKGRVGGGGELEALAGDHDDVARALAVPVGLVEPVQSHSCRAHRPVEDVLHRLLVRRLETLLVLALLVDLVQAVCEGGWEGRCGEK